MSPEERSSANNGIWMCRDHGKAIDSTDPEFTVDRLREWKKQAENESWRRVLRNEAASGQADAANAQLAARMRAAAEADLKVFRQTAKWPSTSVALTLEVDGFDEPVTTSALADAVTSLDDLILVAPPGMGKTTTLFQIAEGVLANGKGTPLVVPLGDWATESATVISTVSPSSPLEPRTRPSPTVTRADQSSRRELAGRQRTDHDQAAARRGAQCAR
jgi:hypothetical protein